MFEIIDEHIQNISIISTLTKTDLIRTYRGAILSWAWAIIRPAFRIFIYYFMLAIGLKVSKDMFGYPYFLWLISGMVPWFYINDILSQGSESIRKYSYLVTKMKIPICIIPTFTSISRFIIHIILMAITICLFIFSGYSLDMYILQLPIYMLFMFLFFTILNQVLSLLSAVSKDFLNIIKSSVFAIFALSGVIWDISSIHNPILKFILELNPVTFLVNGYRNCFIKHVWFWEDSLSLIAFIVVFLISCILSVICYKKFKKIIPDVL